MSEQGTCETAQALQRGRLCVLASAAGSSLILHVLPLLLLLY